ncbi:MAG TPA: HlyD family secretion protein [Gemmatimonadales bacterium]|nr:HlyD family secretion protein [Gemmatimonadales bacterium]
MTASNTTMESPRREAPRPSVAAPGAPAPARARRPLPLIILGVIVTVVAVVGIRKFIFAQSHVETDNAQVDGHITPVAPKVQAFVAQVRVEENQHVNAGDTLVVLDDRDLTVRLDAAEADLAAAVAAAGSRGRSGQAVAQFAASQAQAASQDAAVISAEAAARKAAADLERIRGLAAQKIVPAQQLDAAQAANDAAQANLEAAKRQAAAANSQVQASGAAVSGAEARLASARAAVANARLQLSYAVITAPIGGVVGRRSVEQGALVQVGQTLMSVIPDSNVWVTANLKETDLADVKVGDSVEFTVDAYPGRHFRGHVESLSPATGARFALLPPDNATGNFTKVVQRVPVRIAVDGEDREHPLRPGMSVVVTIATR